MHTVNLLAAACPAEWREPLPEETKIATCCLTGQQVETISRKHLLGSSFTEFSSLKVPESDRIGVDAWCAFQAGYYAEEGKKRRKKPEAMACWWTDGVEWVEINKAFVREKVLNGSGSRPWAGWVTTSYKKHGSLRSPVNKHPFGVWGFDEYIVDCSDKEKVNEWWNRLRKAQDSGLGRTTLENVQMPVAMLAKADMAAWLEFKQWAGDKKDSALYKFLCYLLLSQEELMSIASVKVTQEAVDEQPKAVGAVNIDKPVFDGIIESVKPREQLRLF